MVGSLVTVLLHVYFGVRWWRNSCIVSSRLKISPNFFLGPAAPSF